MATSETDDERRLRELIELLERAAALAATLPLLDVLESDFKKAAQLGRHILSGEDQS